MPCPMAEYGAALGVLYHRIAGELRPSLVAEALKEAEQGRVDLSGLWIARRRGRIVGALLTQRLPGHAAAVWAPEVEPSWGRGDLAERLLRAALADLQERGVRIVQALVDASAPTRASTDLTRAGMPHVTDLAYLGRPTAPPLAEDRPAPRFTWRPFGPETEAEFREIIQRTYLGSLDMPELEGARSLDDVLASHQAGGRFDPNHWQIGRLPGEPGASAIVLLSDPADRDAWEVAYLGLTPEARGRGLGRSALSHALALARNQTPRLELAVDARNHPAERLYLAAGFQPFERRNVHLKVMNSSV
ncbi:MAG: GNAT family N-acetyltransferase [Isosphaeraceae bacterium]